MESAADGDVVGETDGTAVGTNVGAVVGTGVGTFVGIVVGDGVGELVVGFRVGDVVVGDAVGEIVGVKVSTRKKPATLSPARTRIGVISIAVAAAAAASTSIAPGLKLMQTVVWLFPLSKIETPPATLRFRVM